MSLARAASLYQTIHALLPDCIRCAFTRAHSQQELTDLLAAGSVPTALQDEEFVLYDIQKHPRSVVMRLVRSEAARRALSMREERALAREVRRCVFEQYQIVVESFEADEMLATILRSRCGLALVAARSWLVDRNATFA
jgi:hypothetical protein